MRYRAFPIARRTRPAAKAPARSSGDQLRLALTLFGAALIVGGLLRLATDDTVVQVASADLSTGPTHAASSEHEPDSDGPAGDQAPGHVDGLDAAVVGMLSDGR